jgi:hypothetical protein
MICSDCFPGRCPGLICCGPFGAKAYVGPCTGNALGHAKGSPNRSPTYGVLKRLWDEVRDFWDAHDMTRSTSYFMNLCIL